MSLPWHAPLLARLTELRERDQLPNAIALCCPTGWGHEELLTDAALAMLGLDPATPVRELAHPDFRWLEPDGAEIKIDQVRMLNEFAVGTAQMAGRKVAALLNAHLLNHNAGNALLKTLEEPPPNTHLLLATTNWGRVLPTIRSRCQRFVVAPDIDAARSWLIAQGIGIDDVEFAECGYAPLTAAEALAGAEAVSLTDWLVGLPRIELARAVKVAADQDTVVWLARWYRRLLLHLGGMPVPGLQASAAALTDFADQLIAARRQIETSNSANVQLLLESLVVSWRRLAR